MFSEQGNIFQLPGTGMMAGKEITIILNKTSRRVILKHIAGTQTVISSTIKRAEVSAFLIKMLWLILQIVFCTQVMFSNMWCLWGSYSKSSLLGRVQAGDVRCKTDSIVKWVPRVNIEISYRYDWVHLSTTLLNLTSNYSIDIRHIQVSQIIFAIKII